MKQNILTYLLFVLFFVLTNQLKGLDSENTSCSCPSDMTFHSQAELDAFCYDCSPGAIVNKVEILPVEGTVYWATTDVTDLSALSGIQEITQLLIYNSPLLNDLSGLSNMKTINKVVFKDCDGITDFSQMHAPLKCTQQFNVQKNENLTTLEHLQFSNKFMTYIVAIENPSLQDISCYEDMIATVRVEVHDNEMLEDCAPLCKAISNYPIHNLNDDGIVIYDNNTDCDSESDIIPNCIELVCSEEEKYLNCVESILEVPYVALPHYSFQAIDILRSNATHDSTDLVSFRAKECIEFDENFEVRMGSPFEAVIDTCKFIGEYLKDFSSIPMYGRFEGHANYSNVAYPASIYTKLDKSFYYDTDISATGVSLFREEIFNACNSVTLQLFIANGSGEAMDAAIDERYYQLDYDKNLVFHIDIQQLINEFSPLGAQKSFLVRVMKLDGSSFDKLLTIKGMPDPEFNPPTNQNIPLKVLKESSMTSDVMTGISGAVSFPLGYLKKSELDNLELSSDLGTVTDLTVKPVSFWNHNSPSFDNYVKWVKINFVGSPSATYTLNKSGGNTYVLPEKGIPSSFHTFQTSFFNISSQNGILEVARKSNTSDAWKIQPVMNRDNSDYEIVASNIEFLEQNDIRKVIRMEGHYRRNNAHTKDSLMTYVTIVKVYNDEPAVHIEHQDIFADEYYNDEFISQLGMKFKNSFISEPNMLFNFSNGNSLQTSSLSDNQYLLHSRKENFILEDSGNNNPAIYNQGQLLGGFQIGSDWTIAVDNIEHTFPAEVENFSNTGTVFVNAWPTHFDANAFSFAEMTDNKTVNQMLPLHMGDTLSLKNPQDIISHLDDNYVLATDDTESSYNPPDTFSYLNYKAPHNIPFNIDHMPPQGMAIGMKYSLYYNVGESLHDLTKLTDLSPKIVAERDWFLKTGVEPYLFDPDKEVNPLLEHVIRDAYPGYKRLVFDNPENQYGMFTYGCMHDQAHVYPDGNDYSLCTCSQKSGTSYTCNGLNRTWSFAHYKNIWGSWFFTLLNTDDASYDFADAISTNFKNIGVRNIDGYQGRSKKGDQAHAYADATNNVFLRSEYFPWGNDYGRGGHYINPSGLFYNYLINDDFISDDLYQAWFENKSSRSNAAMFGNNRNGNQNLGEILYHLSFYNDPMALSIFSMMDPQTFTMPDAIPFFDDYINIYQDDEEFGMWHRNWVALYEDQFRDYSRANNLLSYIGNGTIENKVNIKLKRILADKNLMSSDEYLRTLIPFLSYAFSTVYDQTSSELNGFGLIGTYSITHTILHEIPFVIQILQDLDITDIEDISRANYPYQPLHSQYDQNLCNVIVENDPDGINDLYFNVSTNFYNASTDSVNLFEPRYYNSEIDLINDYLSVHPIDYTQGSVEIIDMLGPTYMDIVDNPMDKYSGYHIQSYYEPDGSTYTHVSELAAPLQRNQTEVQRLRSTDFGTGVTDLLLAKPSRLYVTGGFNEFFINTIDDLEVEFILSRKEDPLGENGGKRRTYPGIAVYYRFAILKASKNNDLYKEDDYKNFVDEFTNIKHIGNPTSNSDFIIKEGFISAMDNSYVKLLNKELIGHYPAILITSSCDRELEWRIGLTDIDESNEPIHEDIYISTDWEDLVIYRNDLKTALGN